MPDQPISPPTDPDFEKTASEIWRTSRAKYNRIVYIGFSILVLLTISIAILSKMEDFFPAFIVMMVGCIILYIWGLIEAKKLEDGRLQEIHQTDPGFLEIYRGWKKKKVARIHWRNLIIILSIFLLIFLAERVFTLILIGLNQAK